MPNHDPATLARYEGFGSLTRCAHGCVHLSLGFTRLTLSKEQYLRFVALVSESAANLEFFRLAESEADGGDERDNAA